MSTLFISLLTLVLILISIFVVFLVLMQKSQSGGMGSALGGGMAESAFGADTSNVLTKTTIYSSIAFFIVALILYLLYQTSNSELSSKNEANLAPVFEETNSDTLPVNEDNSIIEIEIPSVEKDAEEEK